MDFQDGSHLGFLIRTILSTFVLQVTSILPMVQEKKFKIDFQHGSYGNHLGFPIGTVLTIFDLQVTTILLIKFQVNWPFRSGEVQNRFSIW